MKYQAPFGSSDPDESYVDRNLAAGIQGSRVGSKAVEHHQRELVHLIEYSGQTPAEDDLEQVRKAIQVLARERLRGNLTVYVRTDGNDANNGLANTAAGAFKTIRGAWAAIKDRYDAAGFSITIQLGQAGSYVGCNFEGFAGLIYLRGDPANQDNYVITKDGSEFWCLRSGAGTSLAITGVKVTMPGASLNWCVYCNFGGTVSLDSVTLELTAGGGGHQMLCVQNGGIASLTTAIKLVGNCSAPFLALNNAVLQASGNVVCTIVGTPSYAVGFVSCSVGAVALMAAFTFVGSFTGPRYAVSVNGVIQTGGSATYFPGSAAGTVATGGQYV